MLGKRETHPFWGSDFPNDPFYVNSLASVVAPPHSQATVWYNPQGGHLKAHLLDGLHAAQLASGPFRIAPCLGVSAFGLSNKVSNSGGGVSL